MEQDALSKEGDAVAVSTASYVPGPNGKKIKIRHTEKLGENSYSEDIMQFFKKLFKNCLKTVYEELK